MYKIIRRSPLLLLFLVLLGCAKPGSSSKSEEAVAINWVTMEELSAKMKQQPKKVLVDVYTDWCGWCRKMDKSTFTDPKVAAYVNQHYYAVKLNAESQEAITFKGKTFQFSPKHRAHELALTLLNGQMSYPSTVYMDEQLRVITPVPGYLDAPAFAKVLSYFGEDNYKTMSWQEFEKK